MSSNSLDVVLKERSERISQVAMLFGTLGPLANSLCLRNRNRPSRCCR